MIAVFYLRGLFRRRTKNEAEQQGDIATADFLGKQGLGESSMEAHMVDIEVTSPDDVLPPDSLKLPEHELRQRELEHRWALRRLVLYTLIVPMAIIPIWFMVLLTVPVFDKDSDISESMQIAYLTAVASDFVGLYYIITRDLFPDGKRDDKRK